MLIGFVKVCVCMGYVRGTWGSAGRGNPTNAVLYTSWMSVKHGLIVLQDMYVYRVCVWGGEGWGVCKGGCVPVQCFITGWMSLKYGIYVCI